VVALVALLSVSGVATAAMRGGHHTGGHHTGGQRFQQRNLVSDLAGRARVRDPNLVNPWGVAAPPNGPLWVADNGTDLSTVYTGGAQGSAPQIAPIVVRVADGAPTGLVFNGSDQFKIPGTDAPARFIFDSEAGTLTAWSPNAAPTDQARMVARGDGAIYKGLALAQTRQGQLLYATDFHNGRVDVFDSSFKPMQLGSGAFTDTSLPAGFAPFNVQTIGRRVVVTYAKQDADREDDVAGAGLGYVDVYTTSGHLVRRLVSQGALNAPWGLALAPRGFGAFGGDLLVGNFGDGRVNAYNPHNGRFEGTLRSRHGRPVTIDGLWSLTFDHGAFGTPGSLVFTAGIQDEAHGLLGEIVAGSGR
jgi:uncharacterized protein (TIGR03118 family)